jgi:site-specific DNA recombinase
LLFLSLGGVLLEKSVVLELVKAIARARDWYEQIVAGEVGTIKTLCQRTGLGRTYVKRILRFATLSPQIAEAILSGKHRPDLTL